MTPHREKLDSALQELRRQVEALVREEQLRDQLTGLANGQALSELLKSALESAEGFWCALVEIDYFKRINDEFTYEVADGLLQKIAKRLSSFEDYLSGTIPIRAHGDEFYLFGQGYARDAAPRIHDALDRLREEIAGIHIPTEHGDMACTVSVGWMTTDDGGEGVLTERAVLRMVEAAAGAAKVQGRNRVVRYSPQVEKTQRHSLRDDCPHCRASFTVEVPLDTTHTGDLRCPNCGAQRPRPTSVPPAPR
jgi:two-component system, cell cycle response regulator